MDDTINIFIFLFWSLLTNFISFYSKFSNIKIFVKLQLSLSARENNAKTKLQLIFEESENLFSSFFKWNISRGFFLLHHRIGLSDGTSWWLLLIFFSLIRSQISQSRCTKWNKTLRRTKKNNFHRPPPQYHYIPRS